eukprot:SAG25_NODE_345_length_9393_cov_4.870468_7_plen_83_part_00
MTTIDKMMSRHRASAATRSRRAALAAVTQPGRDGGRGGLCSRERPRRAAPLASPREANGIVGLAHSINTAHIIRLGIPYISK